MNQLYKMPKKNTHLVPAEIIEKRILLIRGEKAILDVDLAELYGVPTKVLNQAVKRNRKRFPPDFLFRLTKNEKGEVVTNCDHLRKLKFSPTLPYAFTEHGAIMAANVLNSEKAIDVSVHVVRAFIKLRRILASHADLARKLDELEGKYDRQFAVVFEALRQLMSPPPARRRRRIGFTAREKSAKYSVKRKR
ncbi:MAG: ORF6N domain-containing protein [Proteobacteria bacterium]|nr:ORF6N domain-containing protein [Pseudomonadota bacterium]